MATPRSGLTERSADGDQLAQERVGHRRRQRGWAIARRKLRILVHFHEDRVHPGGDRGPGEDWNELPLAAAGIPGR
jgi:hypothetical protein